MKTDSDSNVYQIQFTYRFEAAHRFTGSCSESCATPHGHTWYAKACFQAPSTELDLDGNDMIVEFAELKKNWKRFIQETADHSFLHHHEDPILPALRKAIPKFRGLPFPGDPTTELVAALFFAKLEVMHASTPNADRLYLSSVAIRETPTNSMIFRRSPSGRSALLEKINARYNGWWQSAAPGDRKISQKER